MVHHWLGFFEGVQATPAVWISQEVDLAIRVVVDPVIALPDSTLGLGLGLGLGLRRRRW
jgi:hypothetical protein